MLPGKAGQRREQTNEPTNGGEHAVQDSDLRVDVHDQADVGLAAEDFEQPAPQGEEGRLGEEEVEVDRGGEQAVKGGEKSIQEHEEGFGEAPMRGETEGGQAADAQGGMAEGLVQGGAPSLAVISGAEVDVDPVAAGEQGWDEVAVKGGDGLVGVEEADAHVESLYDAGKLMGRIFKV
jgi:hypothetical protein